jgi:hypothetical protein
MADKSGSDSRDFSCSQRPDRLRNPLSLLRNGLRASFSRAQSGRQATLGTPPIPKLRIDGAKFPLVICLHDVLLKQTRIKLYLSEKYTRT